MAHSRGRRSMERFVSGDVVVVKFPFSDLTSFKKRPSLILKKIAGDDFVLCEITANSYEKTEEVNIKQSDFTESSLKKDSFVRFSKLFTGDYSIIEYKIGKLKEEKLIEILHKISTFFIEK